MELYAQWYKAEDNKHRMNELRMAGQQQDELLESIESHMLQSQQHPQPILAIESHQVSSAAAAGGGFKQKAPAPVSLCRAMSSRDVSSPTRSPTRVAPPSPSATGTTQFNSSSPISPSSPSTRQAQHSCSTSPSRGPTIMGIKRAPLLPPPPFTAPLTPPTQPPPLTNTLAALASAPPEELCPPKEYTEDELLIPPTLVFDRAGGCCFLVSQICSTFPASVCMLLSVA